jgi:hypothetical protein
MRIPKCVTLVVSANLALKGATLQAVILVTVVSTTCELAVKTAANNAANKINILQLLKYLFVLCL